MGQGGHAAEHELRCFSPAIERGARMPGYDHQPRSRASEIELRLGRVLEVAASSSALLIVQYCI